MVRSSFFIISAFLYTVKFFSFWDSPSVGLTAVYPPFIDSLTVPFVSPIIFSSLGVRSLGLKSDTNAQAVANTLRKEVLRMRITFHIGRYTFTIIVKKRTTKTAAHSGK